MVNKSKKVSIRRRTALSSLQIKTKNRRAKKISKNQQKSRKRRTGGGKSFGILRNTLDVAVARNDDIGFIREIKFADLNYIKKNGEKLSRWAFMTRNPEAVKALLEKGIDLDAVKKYREELLIQKVSAQDTDLAKALLEPKMVEALLTEEVDPSVVETNLEQLLIRAVIGGNLEIVKDLLEKRADPNAIELIGRKNALTWAVIGRNLEIVNALLKKGADPNAVEEEKGKTAFIWALTNTDVHGNINLEIANALLENGADPKAVEPTGKKTALMLAAIYRNLDMVKALLEKGADPRPVATSGNTALEYSAGDASKYIQDAINKLPKSTDTPV